MTDLYQYYLAHQTDFIDLAMKICAIATILNRLLPGTGMLHDLLGRLALFDKEGKLSLPLIHGNAPKAKEATVTKLNLVPIVALVLAGLSACSYCQQPAHKGSLECKALTAVAQCGPHAAEAVLAVLPELMAGQVDQALSELQAKAPAEYECIVQVLQNAAAIKYGPDSPEVKKLRAAVKAHASK